MLSKVEDLLSLQLPNRCMLGICIGWMHN